MAGSTCGVIAPEELIYPEKSAEPIVNLQVNGSTSISKFTECAMSAASQLQVCYCAQDVLHDENIPSEFETICGRGPRSSVEHCTFVKSLLTCLAQATCTDNDIVWMPSRQSSKYHFDAKPLVYCYSRGYVMSSRLLRSYLQSYRNLAVQCQRWVAERFTERCMISAASITACLCNRDWPPTQLRNIDTNEINETIVLYLYPLQVENPGQMYCKNAWDSALVGLHTSQIELLYQHLLKDALVFHAHTQMRLASDALSHEFIRWCKSDARKRRPFPKTSGSLNISLNSSANVIESLDSSDMDIEGGGKRSGMCRQQ